MSRVRNMCCDISAVNSLSVLERKNQNQHQLFCASHDCCVLHQLPSVSFVSHQVNIKKKLPNDMHSQKTVLHINCRLSCLRLTSTAVFHKTAVLHINCRLSVCLNLVEIKHMPKTQIKLFHAGLKNNMQKRANIPKPTVTNLENISSIPVPPLKLRAVRRQDMPKKTSVPSVCMNSYGSSCLGSLKSHAARRAALTAAKIPLASSLV